MSLYSFHEEFLVYVEAMCGIVDVGSMWYPCLYHVGCGIIEI